MGDKTKRMDSLLDEDEIPIDEDDIVILEDPTAKDLVVTALKRYRVVSGPPAWDGRLGTLVRLDADRMEIVLRIVVEELSYDVRFPISMVEAEAVA